jgi:hypothetical protein
MKRTNETSSAAVLVQALDGEQARNEQRAAKIERSDPHEAEQLRSTARAQRIAALALREWAELDEVDIAAVSNNAQQP